MTNFTEAIEKRLDELRAERERIIQEYQKQLDIAVAPYNAVMAELERLLETNHQEGNGEKITEEIIQEVAD